MNGLKITFQAPGVYSLAAQQNAYRLFTSLKLSYPEAEGGGEDVSPTLRDVTVRSMGSLRVNLRPLERLALHIAVRLKLLLYREAFSPRVVLTGARDIRLGTSGGRICLAERFAH